MGFDVGAWDYGRWGGPGFGRKDIEAARGQGASEYQLRQLYQRAGQIGINRGGRHAQEIQRNAPRPEWNYGGHGYWGFGMKDVNAIGDLATVKRHRDWAQQNRLNIGSGVGDWIDMQQGILDNKAAWKSDLQNQMADLTAQINEPVAPPGVGYSASSVVGTGGTRTARLQTSRRGSRSGTKRWKRGGDSSWSMATVNTGGTSGKASNSSPVNV